MNKTRRPHFCVLAFFDDIESVRRNFLNVLVKLQFVLPLSKWEIVTINFWTNFSKIYIHDGYTPSIKILRKKKKEKVQYVLPLLPQQIEFHWVVIDRHNEIIVQEHSVSGSLYVD